jgi:hypothetical protein
MSPHASQRRCRSLLVVYRITSFFLLCLCGFLFGGAGVLLFLLLFGQNELSTIWPPSPFEVVCLGLGSLIGGSLGIWAGVRSEMEWRKDDGQL